VGIIDTLPEDYLENTKLISLDYETTGLKPHATGHQIACVSIAKSEKQAITFMMPGNKISLRRILANLSIQKMAHNIKFEETWSTVCLRQPVQGWDWDTMLAAHILDNRPGVSGLKFQGYVHFGILGYENEVASYLKAADSKNGNAFNKVMELIKDPVGKKELLTYCGVDTLLTYKLAALQKRIIEENATNTSKH